MVGGRVGGLLNPPGARVLAVVPWAVLEATEDVTPGLRAVVVVPTPGRLAAVPAFKGPFVLEGVAGEGLAGSAAAAGASSCWTTSKLSDSDMVR